MEKQPGAGAIWEEQSIRAQVRSCDLHAQMWHNWSPRSVHADSSMPFTGELSVGGTHSDPLAKQNVKDLFSQMNDKP